MQREKPNLLTPLLFSKEIYTKLTHTQKKKEIKRGRVKVAAEDF